MEGFTWGTLFVVLALGVGAYDLSRALAPRPWFQGPAISRLRFGFKGLGLILGGLGILLGYKELMIVGLVGFLIGWLWGWGLYLQGGPKRRLRARNFKRRSDRLARESKSTLP